MSISDRDDDDATELLNFDGRSGAIQTVPLLSRRGFDRKQRQRLRALLIEAHRKEFLQRMREYARGDLMKARRSLVRKAFGAVLRRHRKLVGYSQEELAQISGIDRTYPSLMELGLRTPTISVVVALACALKLQPVELYCEFLDGLREAAAQERRNKLADSAANAP